MSLREKRIGASGGRLDTRAEDGSCGTVGIGRFFVFFSFFTLSNEVCPRGDFDSDWAVP